MNKDEMIYWIWFSKLKNIGNVKKIKLLDKYINPKVIFHLKESELRSGENDFLTEKNINDIVDVKQRENLDKYYDYINKMKINIITLHDEKYPLKLKQIYDKPILIYAWGNINLLNSKGIAIVGSRECTSYGINTAKEIAYNLAKENIAIISGLAKGIDTSAHIGALQAGGNTIAVIGNRNG